MYTYIHAHAHAPTYIFIYTHFKAKEFREGFAVAVQNRMPRRLPTYDHSKSDNSVKEENEKEQEG